MSKSKLNYRQTLPESIRVLTDEQIGKLESYKHSSVKSSYETFLCNGPCKVFEEMVPSFLSANSVTIIGQLPLQIMIIVMLSQVGTNISMNDPVPGVLHIMTGFSIYWFSLWDIMDGLRARRLKCGSPLGRFIDEAGDTITQSNFSILLAYAY